MDKTSVVDTPPAKTPPRYCSFCGESEGYSKLRAKFRHLIAGPAIFICDECVDLCVGILEAKRNSPAPAIKPAHAPNSGE